MHQPSRGPLLSTVHLTVSGRAGLGLEAHETAERWLSVALSFRSVRFDLSTMRVVLLWHYRAS